MINQYVGFTCEITISRQQLDFMLYYWLDFEMSWGIRCNLTSRSKLLVVSFPSDSFRLGNVTPRCCAVCRWAVPRPAWVVVAADTSPTGSEWNVEFLCFVQTPASCPSPPSPTCGLGLRLISLPPRPRHCVRFYYTYSAFMFMPPSSRPSRPV